MCLLLNESSSVLAVADHLGLCSLQKSTGACT
uniref:Uncharacterized protein n=1 Tax=Anguilla anguilla TaxID=7936 RepID=A0A0E9SWJ4_ANGAN